MSKSQEELPHELENQFILRLPPEHATAVKKIIHSGNPAMKDKLKIDLSPDSRHAVVQVNDVSLSAKVVDLPSVIESLKTHDRKTFYKTADISQMLLCSADSDLHSSPEEPAASSAGVTAMGNEGEAEKKYIWKHGITPPLKNVRKKRFRKPTKKPPDMKQSGESCSGYIDSKDVEKEVKRLLRSDAEAISSRWEIIVDEEAKAVQSQASMPVLPVTSEIGGHVSSEYCSSIILGIQKLIHYKEKKLQEIQGKAQRQIDLLGKLENLTLKSHFQSVLEQLKLQEKQKYEQIIFLQEQLKYFSKK
ncbi:transcription initiation factor TFIID subunit 7-like isoform X3 [Meriones unguiculatus]|uniref:transcription initiation factor TFIID subunit 7-like isoform X3 n=1 Tax=Meriones unguiculatus TaxID=10047 RepID=UPI00293E1DF0|nr:transcription initiation factor TFIID subunit 7-like isoform X3 [Meriones unguiculatus]